LKNCKSSGKNLTTIILERLHSPLETKSENKNFGNHPTKT
jgi:hypothetical protein